MPENDGTLTHHVYVLLDPTVDPEYAISQVFYVGKGSGSRAEVHAVETGETEKVNRIKEIRAQGYQPGIGYATYEGRTLLSEPEAYRLEAALIWALRGQLANKVSGHGFAIEQHESLAVVENAESIELEDNLLAIFVWTEGVRGGGKSITGDFISPGDPDSWENARRYWGHGRAIRAAHER